jgi:GT2 family glycosyltransferase
MDKIYNYLRESVYHRLKGRIPALEPIARQLCSDAVVKRLPEKLRTLMAGPRQLSYDRWLERHRLSAAELREMRGQASQWVYQPTISIVMPVYNVPVKWLARAIASVKRQAYENWELCLVDDGSNRADTVDFLKTIRHPNIRVEVLASNQGIARASNRAIQSATGDYIGLMDHDDEITPDALFEVVKAINSSDPDLIYSDEDKLDADGNRRFPFFKPDWSPDLLRSQNYICHFTVIRKSIIEAVGGFKDGYDGAQDHDLFLRISEVTRKIHHIPKVLYSWREIDTSTAANPESKPHAHTAGIQAVDGHLKRAYSPNAVSSQCSHTFVQDTRYPLKGSPMVSIIIPTMDGLTLLKDCVDSILRNSEYIAYEIIILNNNSARRETFDWFRHITQAHDNVRVLEANYPFCWSKLNNQGMAAAKGDVYIFLNNDTQVISRDWIERLAEQALRGDVGAVGGLMLYEDGTIQHAGVVVGIGGWADHPFKGMPAKHFMSPYLSPMVKRNVLAVTGSCMAISRYTIETIGPFSEKFLVCGSDVEICLRAHENGLYNIYDPFVRLYHYESKTREPHNIPARDFEMSALHYEKYLRGGDPFYNINLSLNSTTPTLKVS